MKRTVQTFLVLSFSLLFALQGISQDREKAEKIVLNAMSDSSNFELIEFGEFFTQNYSKDIQKILEYRPRNKVFIGDVLLYRR